MVSHSSKTEQNNPDDVTEPENYEMEAKNRKN